MFLTRDRQADNSEFGSPKLRRRPDTNERKGPMTGDGRVFKFSSCEEKDWIMIQRIDPHFCTEK